MSGAFANALPRSSLRRAAAAALGLWVAACAAGQAQAPLSHAPSDANDLFLTHTFPSVAQAEAFAGDPALKAGMARAGVSGQPRIEIFAGV